jgi:hypothetical protein
MTDAKSSDLPGILGDRAPSLRVLGAGALFVPEAPIAYAPLLADKRTTVVGFEPIPTECDHLSSMFGPVHKVPLRHWSRWPGIVLPVQLHDGLLAG